MLVEALNLTATGVILISGWVGYRKMFRLLTAKSLPPIVSVAPANHAPSPIVRAIVDPAHTECVACHRIVAGYTSTEAGLICANCAPLT